MKPPERIVFWAIFSWRIWRCATCLRGTTENLSHVSWGSYGNIEQSATFDKNGMFVDTLLVCGALEVFWFSYFILRNTKNVPVKWPHSISQHDFVLTLLLKLMWKFTALTNFHEFLTFLFENDQGQNAAKEMPRIASLSSKDHVLELFGVYFLETKAILSNES